MRWSTEGPLQSEEKEDDPWKIEAKVGVDAGVAAGSQDADV